jgi:hypothetical protein
MRAIGAPTPLPTPRRGLMATLLDIGFETLIRAMTIVADVT